MTILVLEGPKVVQRPGWRHYLTCYGPHKRPSIARPGTARITAVNLKAVFCEEGAWEDQSLPVSPGQFPCPKTEILALLKGSPQPELFA